MSNLQQEDSQNNSNENDSTSNGRKQHRRNKNEIEREFVCGWPSCGKQYGTNAALYTHTKNKHKGQDHSQTKRPNTESVVGRKGRPLQSFQETKGFAVQSNTQPQDIKRKIDVINIWSDSRFIEMIHLIGMYGDLDNVNLFTREMEEDMTPIDETTIEKQVNAIQSIFGESKNFECPQHVKGFLIKASHFWKQKVQEELNFVLLYSMIYRGEKVQTLQNHILSEQSTFRIFTKLIESKPEKDDFNLFIEKIYKTLSGTQSQVNDSDPSS